MWSVIKKNPISSFAVLLVAVIGGFLIYMSVWQTTILTSPDWCNRAMKAEQLDTGSRLDAALACVGLQKVQLEAVAVDSHIDHATFAIVIIVLIVVVIAGARASWKVSTTGFEGSVSRHDDPPTPVVVTNAPSQPVPTAEAPLPPMAPKP